jgi:amino acid adenylation domain-containing protein
VSALDAAYLTYTSGTTGSPKGVLIEHRSLCAYLTAAIAAFGLGPGDRVLQFAATSFDASVLEIWGTLCSGATLVLRDDTMIVSPADFLGRCADWGISVLSLPTAYWHAVATAVGNGDAFLPDAVRLTLVGGEAMSVQQAACWQRAAGSRSALVNHYGPAETTVAATWHTVPAAQTIADCSVVSIGRPHAHARCYVLDERQRPTPINVAGELYIGGEGVGRGYLNDASLTAKRFVSDPFFPGAIMYRTGDRARFRADGTIEFLGRIDRQAKLRGFRVEPAEIENVLTQHPSVREVVVDLVTGADGSDRLAAFVRTTATAGELRAFLAARLPNHLMPAQVIPVASIPLTPAWKIDRAALATLADANSSEETLINPITPTDSAQG